MLTQHKKCTAAVVRQNFSTDHLKRSEGTESGELSRNFISLNSNPEIKKYISVRLAAARL